MSLREKHTATLAERVNLREENTAPLTERVRLREEHTATLAERVRLREEHSAPSIAGAPVHDGALLRGSSLDAPLQYCSTSLNSASISDAPLINEGNLFPVATRAWLYFVKRLEVNVK